MAKKNRKNFRSSFFAEPLLVQRIKKNLYNFLVVPLPRFLNTKK